MAALAGDDRKLRAKVEAALERSGAGARDWLLRELPRIAPPARARVVRALGRLGALPGGESLRQRLGELVDDADERTRRAAVTALGRHDGADTEALLLAAWPRYADAPTRQALVESLGKVGGAAARTLIAALQPGEDAELARLRDEALLRLARHPAGGPEGAGPGSRVDGERLPAAPVAVRLRCRAGVEELLLEECPAAWQARLAGPGLVDVSLAAPLLSLFVVRTATGFGLSVPLGDGGGRGGGATTAAGGGARSSAAPVRSIEELAAVIAGPAVGALLEHFTDGPIRYRLDFVGGGKQRAALHRLAEAITARRPGWINDPADRCWEIAVFEREERGEARFVGVELQPRLPDPRFGWRVADVPAASHPTLAAALARVGGVEPDDVVWDPFVGSAGELVERALLGPYRALLGGDHDEKALAAARANLTAAGVDRWELQRVDALAPAPRGVTLVLTNPPMGRRVHRASGLADELDRLVEHVAAALVPGGRMAWISPHGARTAEVARRLGLAVELRRQVDMGGFPAELQRLRKPARPGAGRRGQPRL